MRFVLERVTEPEVEPVTLAQMRRHLRLFDDITEDDDDISALITAARQWVEHETGRALIEQRWRLSLSSEFTGSGYDSVAEPPPLGYCGTVRLSNEIQLRRSPVLSIVSFGSVDAAGDETALDAATYELREADSKWPKLVGLSGASWSFGTYRIVFRAGYADTTASPGEDGSVVPGLYKQAIKLWVEANYDRDANMQTLLDVAAKLIEPERCHFGLG